MFVEEFFGILRNTLGTPIFVPWLQGKSFKPDDDDENFDEDCSG
jgi:hypothetical protein